MKVVKTRKGELESFLEQFNPQVFRTITVSCEVSDGFKSHPSGAGQGDVFLLQECVLIVEDKNSYGFPALILTLVAKDWRNVPDAIVKKIVLNPFGFKQSARITLESVEFKQSANKVRIIQMLGHEMEYTHRNFSIGLYHLTDEAFETLRVMLER